MNLSFDNVMHYLNIFLHYLNFIVIVVCLVLLYPVFKKIAVYYYNVYFNKEPFVVTYYDEDGNKTQHYVCYPKSKVFMVDQVTENTLTPIEQLSKKKGVALTITPYEKITI